MPASTQPTVGVLALQGASGLHLEMLRRIGVEARDGPHRG